MPQSKGKHIAVERASKKHSSVVPYGTSLLLRLIVASNVFAFTWSFSVLTTSISSRNHQMLLIRKGRILQTIEEPKFKFFLLARPEKNQMPDNNNDNENANANANANAIANANANANANMNPNLRNQEGDNHGDGDISETNVYCGGLAPAASLLDRIKNGANYLHTHANTDHMNQEFPLDENEPISTTSERANPGKSDWESIQSDTSTSTDLNSDKDADTVELDETKNAQDLVANLLDENILMEEPQLMQKIVDNAVSTNPITLNGGEQQSMPQIANEGAISQNEVKNEEKEKEETHIQIQATNEASESFKAVSLDKTENESQQEEEDRQIPTENHIVDVKSVLGTSSASQIPHVHIDAKKMAAQIFAEKKMMQMQQEEERIKASEEQEMIKIKREAKLLWEQIQSSQQEQVRLQNAKERIQQEERNAQVQKRIEGVNGRDLNEDDGSSKI